MQTNKHNLLAGAVEHFAEMLKQTMADERERERQRDTERGVERERGTWLLCGSVDLAAVKAVRRALIAARLKLWANQA